MTKQVIIVDYGMGNLHSVNKAILAVGGTPVVTGDPALIARAEKLRDWDIFPDRCAS